jgi:hypothetical protein
MAEVWWCYPQIVKRDFADSIAINQLYRDRPFFPDISFYHRRIYHQRLSQTYGENDLRGIHPWKSGSTKTSCLVVL